MTKSVQPATAVLGAPVSRRKLLRATAVAAAAMAGFVATGPAQAAKKSKAAAGYQAKPKGSQRCGGCNHFSGGSCEIVSGGISANGWCKFFTG